MRRIALVLTLAIAAAGSATLVDAQRRPAYRLPAEATDILPASPGVELTTAQCSACHSLDYLVTQPRGKGAGFWRDSVAKMRSVYGADLSDEDAAAISGYLARTFGEAAPPAGR